MLRRIFIAVLVLSVAAQFFVESHPHFAPERLFAWNALYGFLACAALILIAAWFIGRFLIKLAVRLMSAALARQHIDATLVRYIGNIVNVALTIGLIIAFNSGWLVLTGGWLILVLAWVVRKIPFNVRASAAILPQTSK